jgi:hypothetical protein
MIPAAQRLRALECGACRLELPSDQINQKICAQGPKGAAPPQRIK